MFFRRLSLDSKRILVTGGSSGIGRELVIQLAAAGARVIASARSEAALKALETELRGRGEEVAAIPADVARSADRRRLIDAAVQRWGGLDVLINNAGVGASGFFDEADEVRLRTIFEVNFFGATELARLALPHLIAGREPMLVNVSSVIGRRAVPGHAEYCSSKFAMCGWSEALRAELIRFGVHVLLACPGLIDTPFKDNQLESQLRFDWQQRRAMPASTCARKIISAMRKQKNEVVITWDGKLLVLLNRWFPRLVDWILQRYVAKPAREPAP